MAPYENTCILPQFVDPNSARDVLALEKGVCWVQAPCSRLRRRLFHLRGSRAAFLTKLVKERRCHLLHCDPHLFPNSVPLGSSHGKGFEVEARFLLRAYLHAFPGLCGATGVLRHIAIR